MNITRTKAAAVGTTLAGGAALTLFGPASSALALDAGGMHLDVRVQLTASLVARGAAVDVPVAIECSGGDNASLNVQLSERVGKQVVTNGNFIPLSCTNQTVVVRVISPSKPFQKGPAAVSAVLSGCNVNGCVDLLTNTTVRIKKV